MRVGQRRIALAVESVVGARNIPVASLQELPPLLRDALAGVVASIGALDAQLLMVLRTLHFVPESLSRSLEAGNAP
jgi:purine-binding chemotaxis protein CheW